MVVICLLTPPDGSTDMCQVGRRQLFLQEQGPSKTWQPDWLASLFMGVCECACELRRGGGGGLRKLTAIHSLPTDCHCCVVSRMELSGSFFRKKRSSGK